MKIFILNARVLTAYALVFAFAAGVAAFNYGRAVAVNSTPKELPIYSVESSVKKFVVTFDAAWGDEDTNMLIDVLGRYNAKATFFMTGEFIDKYPESVKAFAAQGHEISNHSDTHAHMTKLTSEQMKKEILDCTMKIEKLTGKKNDLFRAPYGEYNDTVITSAKEVGHHVIQWDVDSLDWKDPSPEKMYDTVIGKAGNGSIILFHNGAKNTPEALSAILGELQAQGYAFVTVSELICKDNYTLDHTGRQKCLCSGN